MKGFTAGTLALSPGTKLSRRGNGHAVLDAGMLADLTAISGAYIVLRNVSLINLCYVETIFNPRRGWSWVTAASFNFIGRAKWVLAYSGSH